MNKILFVAFIVSLGVIGNLLWFSDKPTKSMDQVHFNKMQERCRNYAEWITTAEMVAAGKRCHSAYNKELADYDKIEAQIPKNLKGVVTHYKPYLSDECMIMVNQAFRELKSIDKLQYPEFQYFKERTKQVVYEDCIDYVSSI